jgi:hypothetical protein
LGRAKQRNLQRYLKIAIPIRKRKVRIFIKIERRKRLKLITKDSITGERELSRRIEKRISCGE